jgi:tetratricopeptide (TPR) repeat protein
MCRAPIQKCVDGNAAVTRYHMSGMLLGDLVLMKEAAALGSHLCAFTIGSLYYLGIGTDANAGLAEQYWKQADIYAMSWNNLATIEYTRGNAVQAAEYYRKAITLNPSEIRYYMNLANMLGCCVETSNLYASVVDLCAAYPGRQAGLYYLIGNNEYNLGHNEVALTFYEMCLEITPANTQARLMAAMLCPDVQRAHTHVDMVISANRKNVDAMCLKGHLFIKEHDISSADCMYGRVCALAPESTAARKLKDALRIFGPITRKRARVN